MCVQFKLQVNKWTSSGILEVPNIVVSLLNCKFYINEDNKGSRITLPLITMLIQYIYCYTHGGGV